MDFQGESNYRQGGEQEHWRTPCSIMEELAGVNKTEEEGCRKKARCAVLSQESGGQVGTH